MALQDAAWRGRISERVSNQGRAIAAHGRRLDELDDDVDQLQQAAAAHRARVAVFSAIGAIVGSGIGGAIGAAIVSLLQHAH